MSEQWRDVPGFPGYQASSLGRVRSLRRGKPRVLAQNRGGPNRRYLCVGPVDADGVQRTVSIHVMVCSAFYGPRPDGMWVRHLDDDPMHNAADNLRWGAPAENTADMRRLGNSFHLNKVTCPRGHRYDAMNTYVDPRGWRHCRTCAAERRRGRVTPSIQVNAA